MCAGRTGPPRHNTGFALRGHRLFMNPAPPQYLIGVDTGGTYTDAAIIEAAGQRVIATAKSITTKGDLSIGVADAITRAMAAMPQGLHPQDIALVSVSTTLATNAVVEGHGSAVGVLLVGFDASMAERTGIAKAFPGMALARIAGGHDHNGEQAQALDLDALDEAIEQAGEIRFLPILLTSATAIGGLLPLALQGVGLYSPMAWAIIGGLITSTLLARLVTPVVYKLIPPPVDRTTLPPGDSSRG